MKNLSLVSTLLLVLISSVAQASSSEHAMNIHTGNWIGSSSMSYYTYSDDWSGSGKAFAFSVSGSYFLVDHFSLGGSFSIDDSRSSDASTYFGIIADYYIPTGDDHTARVGGSLDLGLSDNSADRIFRLNAGWLTFFRPEFAWGPTLQWNMFKNDDFSGTRMDVSFAFAYTFY